MSRQTIALSRQPMPRATMVNQARSLEDLISAIKSERADFFKKALDEDSERTQVFRASKEEKIGDTEILQIVNTLLARTDPYEATLNLFFPGKSIGDIGVKALADLLRSGKAPERFILDLSNNKNITDAGMSLLADAISSEKCPRGLELNIENNNMTDASARDFLKAIQSGKLPKEINVEAINEEIDALGMGRLAGSDNNSLNRLLYKLRLAEAKGACGLSIFLDGNSITEKLQAAIESELPSLPCVTIDKPDSPTPHCAEAAEPAPRPSPPIAQANQQGNTFRVGFFVHQQSSTDIGSQVVSLNGSIYFLKGPIDFIDF